MSYGVGIDKARILLWLWARPAATTPIGPLAWELPYATGAALKQSKKKGGGTVKPSQKTPSAVLPSSPLFSPRPWQLPIFYLFPAILLFPECHVNRLRQGVCFNCTCLPRKMHLSCVRTVALQRATPLPCSAVTPPLDGRLPTPKEKLSPAAPGFR